MGTPKFRLNSTVKQNGESAIALDYCYRNSLTTSTRLAWQTRLYVKVKLWHKDKGRARLVAGYEKQYSYLNEQLRQIEVATQDLYLKYQRERRLHELTPARFRQELDVIFHGVSRLSGTSDFFPFIDAFLIKYQRDPGFSEGTFKVLRTARQHLIAFEKYRGAAFDLDDWDFNLFKEFTNFLRTFTTAKADNTVHKIIFSGLKRFLEEAHTSGKMNSTKFLSITPRKLKVSKTAADDIYLTRQELRAFYEAELPKPLADVRDSFVGACFVGARISDWDQINLKNTTRRDGRLYLEYLPTKTKKLQRVIIPVHPILKEILERNNGRLPLPPGFNPTAVTTINRPLKEAARKAGFTDTTTRTRRAPVTIVLTEEKATFISSKTARESFFSQALTAGIERVDAKKFMGHKGEKDVSEGYDRRGLMEVAAKYADHPFFNAW